MSQSVFTVLREQLDFCMVVDRYRFRSSLRRLQQACQKAPDDKALIKQLEQLQAQVASSCQKVKQRRLLIPVISFPPELPVSQRIDDIRSAIESSQVVIVAGETGSGKTTQLPKLALALGRGCSGMIGHTQPRRLAARAVASRIAEELGVAAGSEVGFQVRFSDTSTERTLVKLMTDGILLAETQHDPFLNRYDTIIIDEAHERSLNIDFLLGYLKRLLPKRPDLKIIITSATIDVDKFSAHFNDAPIIEVTGRTYPVDILYRPPMELEEETDLAGQVLAAFEEILVLERKARPAARDVLVFLSGEREIREVADTLRKRQFAGLEILPLYARLSNSEQQRVFSSHAGRRIVLTTNVAETSLTVPGIGYVIDSGTARISRYSVRSKIQRLPIEAISQASANQRAGRCGRIGPGVCIRLYSEEDFLNRPDFTDTEITRTNLASVILQMLALKLGDIENFPFVEAPEARAVRDGFRLLEELQAVSESGQLLPAGRLMARLPVDPRLSRVIVEADKRNCLSEALIIVSALSIQDPRERPHDRQQASDEAHRKYAHPESDFWSWINLWQFYEESRQELGAAKLKKFCQKHFLSWMRMREWREVHRQLLLICQEQKLSINKTFAGYDEVHMSLLTGFLSQSANRTEEGSYLGARSRKYFIFPGSSLFKKQPRWIVSAELVETSKLFARMNARVEPQWIEQLSGHLLKREYSEPHWEKKRGQVRGYEKVTLFGLVLAERRNINYAHIDPVISREIFIRDALVTMELNTRVEFVRKNRKLMEEVRNMEERSRRRDILVDEETLFAFYDARLPAQTVDVTTLERWFRKLDNSEALTLLLSQADLINTAAQSVDLAQFPQKIETSDLSLPLQYAFDPGKEADGVSIDVPISVLKQLRSDELDWMVPGLLREKCIALIRALPRAIRKHFVPVPDVVDKVLPQLKREDGSLQAALARQLLRLTSVAVPVDAWGEVVLPEHLNMRIRVLDEKGALLATGRDLVQLREDLGALVQSSISSAAVGSIERTGITKWDFGELPEVHELDTGKLKVKTYPALVDKGDSVDLCLLDSPYRALLASRQGLVRLLMLASKAQVRYLQKEVLQNPALLLAMKSLVPRNELAEQLIRCAYAIAFKVEDRIPVNAAEFDEMLQHGRSEVVSVAMQLESRLAAILATWQALQKRLQKSFSGIRELPLKQDVSAQLARLVYPGFLEKTPWIQIQQLPRYLEAVLLRLDKYPTQSSKDQQWTRELQLLWEQYQERREYCDRHEVADEALDDYRWLLEELRVSLFAQSLGTRVPVSTKRLQKFWIEKVLA